MKASPAHNTSRIVFMKQKKTYLILVVVISTLIAGSFSSYVNILDFNQQIDNCETCNEDSLLVQRNQFLKWYVPFVESRLEKLPDTEIANVIRVSWSSIINTPNHTLINICLKLSQEGISIKILQNLTDTLIGAGVDVTNPWLTTTEILDRFGSVPSIILFNEDLIKYKKMVINYSSFNHFNVTNECSLFFRDLKSNMDLNSIRNSYIELLESQKRFINSKNDYNFIANEMSETTNRFMRSFFKIILHKIFSELEIPDDSEYFLYFREFKTFASDADVLYVGPKSDFVNKKLVQLLPLFGIHMDIATSYQIGDRIENRDIDGDVFLFFFNGEVVESKEGLFNKFYKEKINEKMDKQKLWQLFHPYLCRQLSIWTNRIVPTLRDDNRLDFKRLQYRAVMALISGLSFKFNVAGCEINGDFMERLGSHLDKDEMQIIKNALAFSNQVRNLYQLTSETRWRPTLFAYELDFIVERLADQGIENFDSYVINLGEALEAIRSKYFGENAFLEMTYVPREQDQSADVLRKKRADLLKQIILENTGNCWLKQDILLHPTTH